MMRKITLLFLLSFFAVSVNAQLTDADRSFAVNYLMATPQNIIETVADLDNENFNWKPADGGWSVANCLEHILSTEIAFLGMVQGGIASGEANPDLNNAMADGMMISMLSDRGTAAVTSANFETSGKWITKAEMLTALEESRKNLTEYLNNTDHELRQYAMPLPFGEVDAYQIYLIIGAHSFRHTNQMIQVLAEMESM